jgi:hypothetical protein
MRRRSISVLLAILVLAGLATLPGPASAASSTRVAADPARVAVYGRYAEYFFHYGNPNLGYFHCTGQGEGLDTNGNGLADHLRGRGACLEDKLVTRFLLYSVGLQTWRDNAWRDVQVNPTDVSSSGQPAYLQSYTSTGGLGRCYKNNDRVAYRVEGKVAVRWSTDNTVGTRVFHSIQFDFYVLANDPRCV